MASILAAAFSHLTDPNAVGDANLYPIGAARTGVPYGTLDSPWRIATYEVPPGKTAALETVVVGLSAGSSAGLVGSAVVNLGTFFLVVDGADKAEVRLHGIPRFTGAVGPVMTAWRGRRSVHNFADGVDFTSGQVLTLQWTPQAVGDSRLLAKAAGRLHGLDPVTGTPVLLLATLRPKETTARQVILTYTVPANGFRLFSWDLQAWNIEPVIAGLELFLNGALILETGPLGQSSQSPVFGGSSCGARGMVGGLALPLGGLVLNHGDRLELLGHALMDVDQVVGWQVLGTETTEGGGGGLAHPVVGNQIVRGLA